jgi:hypothetical protein
MRWCNFLEEYSPKFIYIEGPLNVISDAFSCLPHQASMEEESNTSTVGPNPQSELNFYFFHFDDDDFLDCFLNHPPLTETQCPLDYHLIQHNQFDDAQLQQLRQQSPHEYPVMDMGNDVQLICQLWPDRPWHICIPTNMVTYIIYWYHLVLGHPGIM